jgi:hypothetical protein
LAAGRRNKIKTKKLEMKTKPAANAAVSCLVDFLRACNIVLLYLFLLIDFKTILFCNLKLCEAKASGSFAHRKGVTGKF